MNTNPEFYFVTSNYIESIRLHFTLDDAINDPEAIYITTFDANGDKVREFIYDEVTKSYTENFK